jgi:hypothetical protein
LSKDVEPIFQVWDGRDEHRQELDKYLCQPNDTSTGRQMSVSVKKESIIFITPPQPNIQHLLDQCMKIKLAVRRNIDDYICKKKFSFSYDRHIEDRCVYCNFSLDDDSNQGVAQLAPETTAPKPGKKKRVMTKSDDYLPGKVLKISTPPPTRRLSGSSVSLMSPASQGSIDSGTCQDFLEEIMSPSTIAYCSSPGSTETNRSPTRAMEDTVEIVPEGPPGLGTGRILLTVL